MIPYKAWPVFVLAICAVGITGTATLILFATRDKTFAIEPDYYAKGLAWDDAARQRAANERLAWRASAAISCPDGADAPLLTLTLRDANGSPIDDAEASVVIFPHTDARRRSTHELLRREPGRYECALPWRRAGLWRIRLTARRGEEVFTADLDAACPTSPEPAPRAETTP